MAAETTTGARDTDVSRAPGMFFLFLLTIIANRLQEREPRQHQGLYNGTVNIYDQC